MKAIIPILIIFCGLISYGQETPPEVKEKPKFKQEIYGGINFNTNGGLIGGASINYAHNYKEGHFNVIGLEIVQVKHFKSLRVSSLSTGNSFIIGKYNYLTVVRPQFGHAWTLFGKGPQDGARLNLVISGGPSFGLLTPYYYSVQDDKGQKKDVRIEELLVSSRLQVLNSSGFFYGLSETELQMGVNLKTALNFELGIFRGSLTGAEIGWTLEAFPKAPLILVNEVRPKLFNALSLTLFYGTRY